MNLFTIICIAIGLAIDAFAVSITSGAAIKHVKGKNALKIALCFGIFQAAMPLLGWMGAMSLRDFVEAVDHWIAFGLLSFIGCKMIYESFTLQANEQDKNPLDSYVLLMLSFATSIDALAVGVSFAFLHIAIARPIIIIGLVTFTLSLIGVYIGNSIGHFFENRIEVIGGLILIGIGIKIMLEHLL